MKKKERSATITNRALQAGKTVVRVRLPHTLMRYIEGLTLDEHRETLPEMIEEIIRRDMIRSQDLSPPKQGG